MKKRPIILFLLLLLFITCFSQKKDFCSYDSLILKSIKNNSDSILGFKLNTIECTESENKNIFRITFQNGNEYNIYETVYEKEQNNYTQEFIILTAYNRQSSEVFLIKGDNSTIEKFTFNELLKSNTIIKISEETNCQEPNGCIYKNFLLDEFSKHIHTTNYESIKLLTNKYILEKYVPIDNKNITTLNNIAHSLYHKKMYDEALNVLQKILEKYPKRTVAHLNIADSYWELGEKQKAKVHYQSYIQLMKNNKKEKKIPKYVNERLGEIAEDKK